MTAKEHRRIDEFGDQRHGGQDKRWALKRCHRQALYHSGFQHLALYLMHWWR